MAFTPPTHQRRDVGNSVGVRERWHRALGVYTLSAKLALETTRRRSSRCDPYPAAAALVSVGRTRTTSRFLLDSLPSHLCCTPPCAFHLTPSRPGAGSGQPSMPSPASEDALHPPKGVAARAPAKAPRPPARSARLSLVADNKLPVCFRHRCGIWRLRPPRRPQPPTRWPRRARRGTATRSVPHGQRQHRLSHG